MLLADDGIEYNIMKSSFVVINDIASYFSKQVLTLKHVMSFNIDWKYALRNNMHLLKIIGNIKFLFKKKILKEIYKIHYAETKKK